MQIKDFKEIKTNADGLVPVIVQDSTSLKVLMMGYMNEEAFKTTLESGKVTFWSRSRQCIWTKGETSGNFLFFESVSADCDCDTLLVMASPAGPACHKGTTTCWGEDVPEHRGFIRELEKVIKGRYEQMPEGSYTTSLFRKGTPRMAQKVGEEAIETVIEAMKGDKERLVYEASDLIYHLLVLLTSQGLSIEDLEKELLTRHK